jgi:hypothetical protein
VTGRVVVVAEYYRPGAPPTRCPVSGRTAIAGRAAAVSEGYDPLSD